MERMTADLRDCVSNSVTCHTTCLETAAHWSGLSSAKASPQHQRLLQDCAEACLVSAHFMVRMSPFHASYCATCSEICKACAEVCEQVSNGDAITELCAEVCRRCERSCRSMAHSVPGFPGAESKV